MGTPARPLIAVTSRRIPADRISNWLEPAQALPTYYLDALHAAGAVGASLVAQPTGECDVDELLARFDGLLVTGGVDVDPSLYGQERHPETVGTDIVADRWEIELINAAQRSGTPTLAICRGAQLVNVAAGGTLNQHLGDDDAVGPHGIPNGGGGTPNTIQVTPGSRLAAAIGTDGVIGNCHHHQAVAEVGDGLIVSAWSVDGVVEAFERPGDPWMVAVQWHPEDSARHDPVQQRLFESFVAVITQ